MSIFAPRHFGTDPIYSVIIIFVSNRGGGFLGFYEHHLRRHTSCDTLCVAMPVISSQRVFAAHGQTALLHSPPLKGLDQVSII